MRNSSNFPQEGQKKPNVDKFMSANMSGDLLVARLCSKPMLGLPGAGFSPGLGSQPWEKGFGGDRTHSARNKSGVEMTQRSQPK